MSDEPYVVLITPGTLPTPANPYPSNQTIFDLSDGTCRIETGPPTPQVLAEYAAAVTEHPDDSELHLYYGIALQAVGRLAEALKQFQEAVRLDPMSQFARSMLADGLRASGQTKDAVAECREALQLFLHLRDEEPDQAEAILRWSLANSLHLDDKVTEAMAELEAAIRIQEAAVAASAGSPQLLEQLQDQLTEWK